MIFHADYEIEFEIYEKEEGDWRSRLLGHMVALNPAAAKERWVENHKISAERRPKIFACTPLMEWK